jgi:manganese/zinc/iron transport system substrate-binding protein
MLRLFFLFIVLSFVGCDRGETPRTVGRPKVVATVAMVGDVARQIAGEHAEVVTLLGSGIDPHLYRPSRDDVAQLQSADVIFYVGYHLEGKMGELLESTAKSRKVIAVAEQAAIGLPVEDGNDAIDPHAWMDPARWSKVAQVIADQLAAAVPEHATVFRDRAEAYQAELRRLDDYARQVTATLPVERRVLVTSHDAFQYFRRAYDFRELSLQGVSTESEASLGRINEVVDAVVEGKVPAVFVESSVSPKSVQALIEAAAARGHTVGIGGELFSDAMGESGSYEGTYVGMIDHNVTTIVRALGGTAPERGLNGKLQPR